MHTRIAAVIIIATLALACGAPRDDLDALSGDAATADDATRAALSATVEPSPSAATPALTPEPSRPSTPEPPPTTEPSATRDAPEGTATVPPPCRRIDFSASEALTDADLDARGTAPPNRVPFVGDRLRVPSIGLDLKLVAVPVHELGVIVPRGGEGNADWHDFSTSTRTDLGGSPGSDAGNIIVTLTYLPPSRDLFYRPLERVRPGDIVQIDTTDGRTLAYEIEFNKLVDLNRPDKNDYAFRVLASTPEESISLITLSPTASEEPIWRVAWGRAMTTACS